ncbi:RNA polymerase-binding protein DksA [Shimwellia pseudoproteus]|uniref:RNA polymerase-binding protein DksA n=1 Tax=Shimwellia pseudoproteus TaxID=570012 RepID=UPI0018EDD1EB|nr:RNA polymerase-binding protein DksA [Shimwellia pseudoproteus]MBJ3814714.1 RNA polymerase-binding protein DksA [Shimwellia pseudoproteus]
MTKPTHAEREYILTMPPEEYMNHLQQDYFRRLLRHERAALLEHIEQMKHQLQESPPAGDEGDIALREEQLRLLFRQIDRESRLLPKYDAALVRLQKGEYGYCRETGDPIGLPRLLLRPTAELGIEAKTKAEKVEVQYRKK